MNISRYQPRYRSLGLLDRLLQDQEIGSLLNAFENSDSVSDWHPAVDIREEDERFLLEADLPGVDPDNIEVTMEDGILTIQGKRESETNEEQRGYKRYERISGNFLRRFTLPDTAKGDDISATTKHGVLEVTIPKQAKQLPRKISVKTA
ncbi:MAG: Hsp20/alpha crystallin family protein [Gammaproteobacteria bacterium]